MFVELVWLMFACDCDVNLVIWFVGGCCVWFWWLNVFVGFVYVCFET